jgi:hypothetical protein
MSGLLSVSVLVFAISLPCGYWRAHTTRFSLQWFLAVHLPIPAIIILRVISGIGWHPVTFPALIGAYFAGQLAAVVFHSSSKK